MMRTIFLLTFLLACSTGFAQGNSGEPKFYATVSRDEIHAGNTLEVTITLENSQNGRFTPPDWVAAGISVLGSSQSSNFSFSNGASKSTANYNYTILLQEPGEVEIPAATLTVGDKKYKTALLTVKVLPNPDGIKDGPAPRKYAAPTEPAPAKPEKNKKPIKTVRI